MIFEGGNMDKIKRLDMKGRVLNNESLWVPITISQKEVQLGINMGKLQESESKKLKLKDRSFHGTPIDSLNRSIAAKQAELAVRKFGGSTARVVGINEFHDFPDVGEVNVRYTGDIGYGLVITNRDQGLVPMILVTGSCPDFKLMGWIVPDYIRQMLYKVHQGRNEDCQSEFGFMASIKEHEAFQVSMQCLLPMKYINMELIK